MARLLRHKGDGRFEALQYQDDDPTRFERKDLDVAQAIRYRDEGGFRVVDAADFDSQLRTVSDATRKSRRASMPTEAVLRRANPEGTAYEALEYSKADPRQATRTSLSPEQLERWREQGGFQDVSDAEWRQHLNRTRGVEEAESHTRVAPDFALDEEVPGVRENIAPALNVRASESTSYERPARDEEYAAAQSKEDEQRRLRAIGELGAGINRAITGVDYDKAAYQEAPGTNPVKRLLAQREMDRKARLSDPTSPESKRLQQAVASAMPGAYTPQQLATIAAEDADYVTDFVKVRSAAESRAAAAKEAARRAEEDRTSREKQAGLDREATIRAAGIGAAGKRSEAEADRALKLQLAEMQAGNKTAGANVPGLEFEPGATPTADDAKRVKGVRAAAGTLKSYTQQLRDLYRRNGASLVGESATKMRQLVTSIQLEAKTIAELGALSGPDQQLMERLAGANPTTITGMIRGAFGLDDTAAALDQLDKWVDDKVQAMNTTYGYRPAQAPGSQAAPGVPAASAKPAAQAAPLPPPATLPNGKKAKRVTMPDGSIYEETADGGTKRIK